MAKKNLEAAAAGTLADMKQTQAQKIAQQAQAQEPEKEITKGFTIWTTPENVRRWKAYQKAKKDTLPTLRAFVETALLDYMRAHPVTDEEREALLKSLEI